MYGPLNSLIAMILLVYFKDTYQRRWEKKSYVASYSTTIVSLASHTSGFCLPAGRQVRCSAFAKCLILIPLYENICKDYGFFEAGAEMQSPHNNPIIYIFFIGLEHSGQPGTSTNHCVEAIAQKMFL
jgi:hypothetical protein